MNQILVDTKEVETKKEIVVAQEAEVSAKAAECKKITDEAQAELDRALPMLEKASVACCRSGRASFRGCSLYWLFRFCCMSDLQCLRCFAQLCDCRRPSSVCVS